MDHFKTSSKQIVPIKSKVKKLFIITFGGLYSLIGFPIYVLGLIQNYLPYLSPLWIAKKLTKEAEYYAPIMMSLGILIFPTYYYFSFFWFDYFVSPPLSLAVLYVITLPLSGFFVLHYSQFIKSGITFLKIHNIINPQEALRAELEELSKSILGELDDARQTYLKRL
jgi:hypothetical protein